MSTVDDYLNKKYKRSKLTPVKSGDSFVEIPIDISNETCNNRLNETVDLKDASIIKCSECSNIIGLESKNGRKINRCNHCGKKISDIMVSFKFSDEEITKYYKEYNLKIKKA